MVIPRPIFLPQESVKLGRFIVNIERPHESYHEPAVAEEPKSIKAIHAVSARTEVSSSRKFGSTLTSLLSASFSKRAQATFSVKPTLSSEYVLENTIDWFDKAISNGNTRRWIEKAALRGDKIYMIVGIQTVTDAYIIQSSMREQQAGGQFDVPVSLSLAAAGLFVPLAGLIDPGIHGQHQSRDGIQSQFLVPGEQVCALQYRQIRHKWFSSKAMDRLRLSSTRYWSCIEGATRNGDEDEEDEQAEKEWDEEDLEDMIGVGLVDMDDPGDECIAESSEDRTCYVHT